MDLLKEHSKKYQFFVEITGIAMKVYNKYHYGLLESAYEAAMRYLLEQDGYKVERQVYLPIYWDDVQLDQTYRMDLVINENIVVEAEFICLKGFNSGDTVRIYSVEGNLTALYQISTNGSISIPISTLPSDVFIIKTNKQSIKMIKK